MNPIFGKKKRYVKIPIKEESVETMNLKPVASAAGLKDAPVAGDGFGEVSHDQAKEYIDGKLKKEG